METNFTNMNAYTAPPDSVTSEWKPINYTTTTNGSITIVSIPMYSEYPGVSGKPLPGDLVVEFSNPNQTTEFQTWIIAVGLVAVLLLASAFYVKRRNRVSRNKEYTPLP
jgi:LPXTG-motif cell wall-anchored protein